MVRNLFVALVAAFALTLAPVVAEDKKPAEEVKTTKLVGSLVCGKCKLSETEECSNVLIVKDAKDEKKEIKYYLTDKGAKADYHGKICKGPKDATVTGVVSEKDGKMSIADAKVEFKK